MGKYLVSFLTHSVYQINLTLSNVALHSAHFYVPESFGMCDLWQVLLLGHGFLERIFLNPPGYSVKFYTLPQDNCQISFLTLASSTAT